MVRKEKNLLSLIQMEPIAKDATRRALSQYREPPAEEQSKWTLGKFETESEGIFEIYIPSDQPLDAKVISRAIVDRITGDVHVQVFLDE